MFRYILVGLGTNGIGYVLYLLMTLQSLNEKVAMTILYSIGVCLSFVGNKHLVFASKSRTSSQLLRFLLTHTFGYALNFLLLVIFVDHFGVAHQLVQAVAIFVVALFLFVAFKYFVFKEKSPQEVA